MAIAMNATIVFVLSGEPELLLSKGIAAAWGLLANSHAAELLDVCKLVLNWSTWLFMVSCVAV
jgi:hypothetical protein